MYTTPPECVDITRYASSLEQVLPRHQLGKLSDVWWIISTHESSFVFIRRAV